MKNRGLSTFLGHPGELVLLKYEDLESKAQLLVLREDGMACPNVQPGAAHAGIQLLANKYEMGRDPERPPCEG